jgi:oxaloacetate decarboxylase gamma subunit
MEDGMTIPIMLGQSGILTLLGMGLVFTFLFLVIVSVTLVGKVIHAIGADKPDQGSGITQPVKPASGGAAKTTAVAAAITAAVTEYQKTH